MHYQENSRAPTIPQPIYLFRKELSEDVKSESEEGSKASKVSTSRTSLKIRFQESPAVREIASEKCCELREVPSSAVEEQEAKPGINYSLHLNRLIWLAYCVCSVRVNSAERNEYGWIEVTEVINGLAIVLMICFSCYSEWKISTVMAIHLASIVLTLGFYLSMEEPLHTIIAVCRCMRILLIFQLEAGLGGTLNRILRSLKALSKGLCSVLLIFMLFCLAGMQLFMSDTTYQCRASQFPKGEWMGSSHTICGSLECPSGQYCTSPLQYGLLSPSSAFPEPNFNSAGESIVTMFQLFRMIGWVDIAFRHSYYFNRYISLSYFAAVIFIGPLLMMNLLLSLLYEGFENTKQPMQQPKNSKRTMIVESEPSTRTMGMSSIMKNMDKFRFRDKVDEGKEEEATSVIVKLQTANSRWMHRQRKCSSKISLQNVRTILSHSIIVAQVLLVCLDRADWNELQQRYVGISFGVCMIFWALELIFLVISLFSSDQEPCHSLAKKLIILDAVLFLMIVADYVWKAAAGLYLFESVTPLTSISQPLVCMRIIKLVYQNLIDEKLSLLMRALLQTIRSMLSFVAVIIVLTFFQAAIGLQMFHDQLKLLNGEPLPLAKLSAGYSPPLNFDNLANSFATFSAFLSNEEWPNTLYSFMGMGRLQLVPFFMLVVIMGFVLSELFLATYINIYIEKVKEYRIIGRESIDLTPQPDRLALVQTKKSMFVLDGASPIRQAVTFVLHHRNYRYASIVLLAVYVALLCFKNNLPQPLYLPLFLTFDGLFFLDMFLNIIVYGFFGKYSYTYSGSNILDFIINILVVTSLITPALNQVIAAIRACRVMRFTNYNHSLKILKVSLASSGKDIIRLLLFLLAFLLLSGSMGVKLFKSTTYSCSLAHHRTQQDCLQFGGEWVNTLGIGFDNIVQSVFNMFAVLTAEGWLPIMTTTMLSQPKGESYRPNVLFAYFFLLVFFIGSFIFINIFVGVLVEKIQTINREFDKLEREIQSMTEHRQEWARITHYIYALRPSVTVEEPKSILRFLFRTLHHKGYHLSRNIIIGTNLVVLACFYSQQSLVQHNTLCILNQICFLLSLTQFAVEVCVFGKRRKMLYLDLFTLLLSAPGVYLIYIPVWKTNSQHYQIMKELMLFFKAAQTLRCYRILFCFSSSRNFLKGLFKILPQVSSLMGFFLMVLFIAAILAQDLFGSTRYSRTFGKEEINFDNFFNSMFSLFSLTTGEYWFANAIDLSRTKSASYPCGNGESHNECGRPLSLLYFVVAVMVLSVIFINLLVAVILTLTAKSLNLEESATSRYKLDNLVKLWAKYDEKGQGFINYKTFFQFSMAMAVECGINKVTFDLTQQQFLDLRKKKMFMRILNLPVYEHRETRQYCYLFHDVAVGMSRAALLLKETSNFDFLLHERLDTEAALGFTTDPHKFTPTNLDSGKMAAVILMLNKYRRWRQRSNNDQQSNPTFQNPTFN